MNAAKTTLFLSRRFLITASLVAVVALLVGYRTWRVDHRSPLLGYDTTKVVFGDITHVVTATGTLNPVVLVSVGTQVSGTVKKIEADFNSHVKAGQVLLTLDPTLLAAQVAQSKAAVASAQAALELAVTNAARERGLYAKGYETKANLDQAAESLKAAKAALATAQAQLHYDEVNLSYTVIRSPVNGTVISRDVNVGQTVAASFQTPVLFKIGKDLKKMQIDAAVDEADIGAIRPGQDVTFTVDAFPGRLFKGKVTQIRLNATAVQNVVTYDVVIGVDNDDLTLLPGMTAYVSILVGRHDHVLLVPNNALRVHMAGDNDATSSDSAAGGILYVVSGGKPIRTAVNLGFSDDSDTEILPGPLKAGDTVVLARTSLKKTGGFFGMGD